MRELEFLFMLLVIFLFVVLAARDLGLFERLKANRKKRRSK